MLYNVSVIFRSPQGTKAAYHGDVTYTFSENQTGEILIKTLQGNIIATYQYDEWISYQVAKA